MSKRLTPGEIPEGPRGPRTYKTPKGTFVFRNRELMAYIVTSFAPDKGEAGISDEERQARSSHAAEVEQAKQRFVGLDWVDEPMRLLAHWENRDLLDDPHAVSAGHAVVRLYSLLSIEANLMAEHRPDAIADAPVFTA